MVVNREYSNLTYRLKKLRERIARRLAKLYVLLEKNISDEMEQTGKNIQKQLLLSKQIELFEAKEKDIISQRAQQPYKISVGEKPENIRYNKLKTKSKHLQNIIKIICYRAKTAIANLLSCYYLKLSDEIMALVNSIIFAKADLYPKYQTITLTVRLNSLATPRYNLALLEIIQTINYYEAIFPGTKLKLFYKNKSLTSA